MASVSLASQSVAIGEVLARLERVRTTGQGQWVARCPAHDDRNPSLSIGLGEQGRILLTCHAGCEYPAIWDALNLRQAFRPQRQQSGPLHYERARLTLARARAMYDYPNAAGAVLYKVARYEPKDFRPWHRAGSGEWELGLGKNTRLVPYRLPELRKASPDEPVLLVEGEKDVDRAVSLGFVATTTQGGAQNWPKHADMMAEELKGRCVVIIPDADDSGEAYAQAALATLRPAATNVGILRLPRLARQKKHGEDLSDWLDSHSGTADELRMLMASAVNSFDDGKWRPKVQTLSDLMKKELPPIRHIVDAILPEGLTMIGAKPKKGKTTLMMHIAAAVSGGYTALGSLHTERCEVLYLALEDNERRMQKRMRQMLQDQPVSAGLYIAYEWPSLDSGGLDALHAYLTRNPKIGLVVIDTLEHVRPARKTSNGVYADDYSAIRGLQRLAGEKHIGIVPIHHLRKASADDPFDEFNGSEGLMASVDNAIVLRSVSGVVGMLELHRRGRDYEDDTPLAIKGDKTSLLWKLEGKAQEVFRSVERQDIITLVKSHPNGLAPKDIAHALGKNENTTRVLLSRLLAENPPPVRKEGEVYKAC